MTRGFLASHVNACLLIALFVLLGLQSPLFAISSNVNVLVCNELPSNPTISSPPSGTQTDQSSVLLSGSATPGATVNIYRNGSQVGFVTAANDGSYAISVSLVIGPNVLTASITDDCGNSASSDPVTVVRNDPPPSPVPAPLPLLPDSPGAPTDSFPPPTTTQPTPGTDAPSSGKVPVILEPKDGTTTSRPNVLVRGRADPLTMLRILRNDKLVAEVFSDKDGWFSVSVPLVEGVNRLVVVDGQGTQEIRSGTTTITYVPPGTTADPQIPRYIILLTLAAVGVLLLLLLAHLLDIKKKRRRDVS